MVWSRVAARRAHAEQLMGSQAGTSALLRQLAVLPGWNGEG